MYTTTARLFVAYLDNLLTFWRGNAAVVHRQVRVEVFVIRHVSKYQWAVSNRESAQIDFGVTTKKVVQIQTAVEKENRKVDSL